ncbi:MAG: hypothetical protein ACKESB_01700 [Candidatus Hodgkinia cicadicola]
MHNQKLVFISEADRFSSSEEMQRERERKGEREGKRGGKLIENNCFQWYSKKRSYCGLKPLIVGDWKWLSWQTL